MPTLTCILKLNGTHQLLAYADDVNILGGSVHTVKKKAETLVATAKEIGLEVNAIRVQIFGNNFNESKLYPGRS